MVIDPADVDNRIAGLKQVADADAQRVINLIRPMKERRKITPGDSRGSTEVRHSDAPRWRMDCNAGQADAGPDEGSAIITPSTSNTEAPAVANLMMGTPISLRPTLALRSSVGCGVMRDTPISFGPQ